MMYASYNSFDIRSSILDCIEDTIGPFNGGIEEVFGIIDMVAKWRCGVDHSIKWWIRSYSLIKCIWLWDVFNDGECEPPTWQVLMILLNLVCFLVRSDRSNNVMSVDKFCNLACLDSTDSIVTRMVNLPVIQEAIKDMWRDKPSCSLCCLLVECLTRTLRVRTVRRTRMMLDYSTGLVSLWLAENENYKDGMRESQRIQHQARCAWWIK